LTPELATKQSSHPATIQNRKSTEHMNEFDQQARDWDNDPVRVLRARAVADAIRNHVPLTARMNAMEYGCGTGLLSFELRGDIGPITLGVCRNETQTIGCDVALGATPPPRFAIQSINHGKETAISPRIDQFA
jgi:hypothetical protein